MRNYIMNNNNLCIVFVCNKAYFNKFIQTCNQLITHGGYKGDICLVIGDDLRDDAALDRIKNSKIIVKYFPDIIFTETFFKINNHISSDGRNITKKFQWHKLHLFNTFFKKWEYIFYLDCGMTIFSDVSPILKEAKENTLLAHSDAYPSYQWKLHTQFDKNNRIFPKLNHTFNLNIDYFQTGIMLYDTKIIEENTFNDLYELSLSYPISKTNEQGIMALYFTNIKPLFAQIRTHNENTYFYDALRRNNTNKYIMLKWTHKK